MPPTSVEQLPVDYRSVYADRGYRDTDFNVLKTWTEYLNRLLGVVVGILIFALIHAIQALAPRQPLKRSTLVLWLYQGNVSKAYRASVGDEEAINKTYGDLFDLGFHSRASF